MNKNEYQRNLPDKLYIVGCNEESIGLYNSSNIPDTTLIIKTGESVGDEKIRTICKDAPESVLTEHILKVNLAVIFNTGYDLDSINACKSIVSYLKKIIDDTPGEMREDLIQRLFASLKIFVIGTDEYKSEYEAIEDSSLGCIRYLNKSTSLALDFIDRYPVARFIPRDKILPDTTIDRDFNINVIMVGFSELNKKILTSSIANNQFLCWDNNSLTPKLISYKILDEGIDNSIKATLPLFRYERELVGYDKSGKIIDSPDYLQLPMPPATVEFIDTKLDTGTLISKISSLSESRDTLSLIIVDYSDEAENFSLANAIMGLDAFKKKNIRLFARSANCDDEAILPYAEASVFLDTKKIIKDKLYNMAIERNRIYTLESEYLKDIQDGRFDGDYNDIISLADYKWYTKRNYTDKASNIYAMLSIRSKLNLLGLDYTDIASPLAEFESYDEIYAKGEIKYLDGIEVLGRRIPSEMTYEFTSSTRGILAHQEHYRWNSFMISMGYIPAKIYDIVNEKNENGSFTNGKNSLLKRHGNITTAEGLIKYRQLVSRRDGCHELERDVICYDYQLMDDAIWLLRRNGYKIVRRGNEND